MGSVSLHGKEPACKDSKKANFQVLRAIRVLKENRRKCWKVTLLNDNKCTSSTTITDKTHPQDVQMVQLLIEKMLAPSSLVLKMIPNSFVERKTCSCCVQIRR